LIDKHMVYYEKKESVAVITLKRADSKNIFNTQIAAELEIVRGRIDSDNDIRTLIVTGEEAFWKKLDLEEISLFEENKEVIGRSSVTSFLSSLDRPTIAAINGDAVGSGLEFALACDIRVAADTAHFGFPHIKEGLIPWDGGTQRWVWSITWYHMMPSWRQL